MATVAERKPMTAKDEVVHYDITFGPFVIEHVPHFALTMPTPNGETEIRALDTDIKLSAIIEMMEEKGIARYNFDDFDDSEDQW